MDKKPNVKLDYIKNNPIILKNLSKIFEYLFIDLKTIIDFDGVLIAIFDENKKNLCVKKANLHEDIKDMYNIIQNTKLPLSINTTYNKAIKLKKSIYYDEKDADAYDHIKGNIFENLKIQSSLSIPVIYEKNVLGLLYVYKVKSKMNPDKINDIEELLSKYIQFIIIATDFNKLSKKENDMVDVLEKNKRIIDLAQNINTLESLDMIYNIVLQEMLEVYGFDIAILFLKRGNFLKLVRIKGRTPKKYEKIINKLYQYSQENDGGYKINPSEGASGVAFHRKTHFYFEDITKVMNYDMHYKDKGAVEIFKTPKSNIIVPVINKGSPYGLIHMWSIEDHVKLTQRDINVINSVCAFIATAISNSELYTKLEKQKKLILKSKQELEEKDKIMSEDLMMAKKIQQSIITVEKEKKQNIDFSLYFKPMIEVGGDIYDIYRLDENYYRIFIADATGHGIQAALSTMIIKIEYDKIKNFELKPNRILKHLNNVFVNSYSQINMLFSCCLLDIDIENKRFMFASAGHPDQFLNINGNVQGIRTKGKIIGFLENLEYSLIEKKLEKNMRFLLFTDGLTETFNAKKQEYGEQRVIDLLKSCKTQDTANFLSVLNNSLNEFRDKEPITDDITIIVIDYIE